MNCESFEFFRLQIHKMEKQYLGLLEESSQEIDEAMRKGNLSSDGANWSGVDSSKPQINLNKIKKIIGVGETYLNTSYKFEKEIETLLKLAPNLVVQEVQFETSKFTFIKEYINEIKKSLSLQIQARENIERQVRLFRMLI